MLPVSLDCPFFFAPTVFSGVYLIYTNFHLFVFVFRYLHKKTSQMRRGCDRMVAGLQLPMPSVPITTNVVSSNPDQTRFTRYKIMR